MYIIMAKHAMSIINQFHNLLSLSIRDFTCIAKEALILIPITYLVYK